MALDQVRTQVLLLHSEQSTLDSLSAGFDDRYTVHCATTGSEALNTLGDTPIHVIVSAKNLPGMSGVEALREAKKRSPDTLGILLADEDEKNLEALVGDKEIFQVIQGGIDASRIKQLVDNATQQMRLLALSDSANDRAANPDEPAEHIVMETSENGSAIISDGTGRFPGLDPAKIGAGVSAGARGVDVLVLTRDEEFFSTVNESTRGLHEIHRANTLAEAEKALAKNRIGVAVVDAAMVGEKVEKLTQHLGGKSARLVCIVAGRRDDGEMLMNLINRGKVYRFLLKPVSPGRARLAIEASVKHHLEAPDTAFKGASAAGAVPRASEVSVSRPAARKSAVAGNQERTDLPDPTDGRPGDGLDEAFDGDDSSFTQTMTGIVTNFGRALTKKKETKEPTAARPERKTPSLDKPAAERKKPAAEPKKPAARPSPATPETLTAPARRPQASPVARDRGMPGTFEIDAGAGDDGGGTLFRNPLVLVGSALVIVGLGIAFWLFGGSDESPTDARPVVEQRTPLIEDPFGASSDAPVDSPEPLAGAGLGPGELLDEARVAAEEGRLFKPADSNAIELFVAAADANPDDREIAAELDAVLERVLGMAETAMLESRTEDAAIALARVEYADPANDRLPFLVAQLSQMQFRNAIEAARMAIRENRFEDAGLALADARGLDVTNTDEIALVQAELAEAQSEQQVDELLALASVRLESGTLISPANDNARYYYQRVLSAEPANPVAVQGLQTIASKLVLQARAEIDGRRFDAASAILDEAQQLDPDSEELASAVEALADGREQVVAARRAEQQRIAAERQAAERRAEQDRIAEEQQAERERLAAAAATPASTGGSAADADTDAGESGQSLIAISDLTRTRYVAPKYPRVAERRNLSGWVDVVFTVKTDGATADIEVRDAEPDDVFVNAALRAVERWEFEPIVENGAPVEKQTGVRLMFALE